MAVEVWQAYLENGEPGLEGVTVSEATSGVLHGSVHVWLWRCSEDGVEVLLQQRSKAMPTWPGYLDVSAAGHMDFGESPVESAVRETREELGLSGLTASMLEFAFAYRMKKVVFPVTNRIENEIQWVYLLAFDKLEDNMRIDGSEVDSVRWVGVDELHDLTGTRDTGAMIVPHGDAYFAMLFESLKTIG